MERLKLKGRPAYPGRAAGEALVCPHSIQGWAGINEETGCIIEVGSTGWSGHFHSAAVAGFSPAGWLFSHIDSRCGVAAAALEVPAAADFPADVDIFTAIKTGDWVELDGGTGEVTVIKK